MNETIAKDEHLIVEACSWPEFARLAQERIDEQAAEIERLKKERTDVITTCRRICETHGDNDWSDDLHLSDIIEKHLWRGCDGG